MTDQKARCFWAGAEGSLLCRYHDEEWGVPVRNDRKLFEYLLLDSFQAGLSWNCILNKRETFRMAFDNFDPEKIALYDEQKITALLLDKGIIRNRSKILAAVGNARSYLSIQKEFGSFSDYLWAFTGGKTVRDEGGAAVTRSPLSDAISNDLRSRGMKFVGTVIIYAFLQGVGIIDAHEPQCFRFGCGASAVYPSH